MKNAEKRGDLPPIRSRFKPADAPTDGWDNMSGGGVTAAWALGLAPWHARIQCVRPIVSAVLTLKELFIDFALEYGAVCAFVDPPKWAGM